MAKFAYNNHIHSSTQHTPFFVNTGRHPHIGFEPVQSPIKVEAVLEFMNRMKDTLSEASFLFGVDSHQFGFLSGFLSTSHADVSHQFTYLFGTLSILCANLSALMICLVSYYIAV